MASEKPEKKHDKAPVAPPAIAKKKHVRPSSSRKPKKDKSILTVRGKRKTAVARVTLKPGKGAVRINGRAIESYSDTLFRELVLEPLSLTNARDSIDISVSVQSGGVMGQAQAIRRAIASALVQYSENPNLKDAFLSYDRNLLVEDFRRTEPKKYLGRKARARFQKSYR